jgi:hypothetical protein
MRGSNAAGEPLPLHMMFSSKVKEESNYAVNVQWIFDLPRIFVKFGHDSHRSIPSSVTVNPLEDLTAGCFLGFYPSMLRICFLMQETKKGIEC